MQVNVSLSLQSGPPVCKRPTYEYMKAVSDAASLAYNSLVSACDSLQKDSLNGCAPLLVMVLGHFGLWT